MNNPYLKIIEVMQQVNSNFAKPAFYLGKITEIKPDVLIEFGNIQTNLDKFYKSNNLDRFEKGDELLILAMHELQRFILLCKVVKA